MNKTEHAASGGDLSKGWRPSTRRGRAQNGTKYLPTVVGIWVLQLS